MPKVSEIQPDARFTGLFIGHSKSGKTVAEGSFPGPQHFMDFDGRIRGLFDIPWIDKSQMTYDYFPPRKPGLIPELNKKLETWMVAGAIASVCDTLPKTLVTDSITSQNYAFLCQSIPLTHSKDGDKGKWIGPMAMAGPEDYGLEAQACYDYISYIRSLPIRNIIVSAHLVDRYGKLNPSDKYSASVVIGEKLSIRDKIGENIGIYFDHVFKFEKEMIGGEDHYFVTFRGDICSSAYSQLPYGRIDITGKNFYEVMMSYIKEETK